MRNPRLRDGARRRASLTHALIVRSHVTDWSRTTRHEGLRVPPLEPKIALSAQVSGTERDRAARAVTGGSVLITRRSRVQIPPLQRGSRKSEFEHTFVPRCISVRWTRERATRSATAAAACPCIPGSTWACVSIGEAGRGLSGPPLRYHLDRYAIREPTNRSAPPQAASGPPASATEGEDPEAPTGAIFPSR
jgi:hypothetical protein